MCQTKMGAQQHENPFSPSLVRSMLNRTASEITCPISASASFASQAPTSWDPSTSYLPKTVFALSRNSCGDIAQEETPQKRGKGAMTIETCEWMRPSTWLLSAFVFFCSIPGLRVPQARGRPGERPLNLCNFFPTTRFLGTVQRTGPVASVTGTVPRSLTIADTEARRCI